MTMRTRLGIFVEFKIVEETNDFGLDFIKKTESGFWGTNLDMGEILRRRTYLGFVYS